MWNDDDDLQNFNDNEADDYRNEGDDDREDEDWDDEGTCEQCGEPCDDEICDNCAHENAREANDREDAWGDDDLIDGVGFADPGGRSALRAETEDNPRNLPCPTCGAPNRLTPIDRQRGYQCDSCADRAVHRNEFVVNGSDVIIGVKLDLMLIGETIENAKEYLTSRGWQGQGCFLG